MGAMKALHLSRHVPARQPPVDPRDNAYAWACVRCFEGFLTRVGKCCSCPRGRRRAKRMATSARIVADGEAEKARLRREALAGSDFSRLFKPALDAGKDYGFER